MIHQHNDDEFPDEPEPEDNRVISRLTLIFAIVVLAAIAFMMILMNQ